MKQICVLGSTGSVGVQALDVIRQHPEQFQIVALSARRNIVLLLEQIQQFQPKYVAVTDPQAAEKLKQNLGPQSSTQVIAGDDAPAQLASLPEVEQVVAAIVGAAGLRSTWAAVEAGKCILLANKESLVMAGHLMIAKARQTGAILLPLDSEHSALMQCLPDTYQMNEAAEHGVSKITLTASGGPFLNTPRQALDTVTPAQACAHPTWNMGAKISVDCATLFNKGLEVIEAHWLFGIPCEQIDVVIHPQSCIHALVHYVDGSVLAHLGTPDMRTPIAYALAWPKRISAGVTPLDFSRFDQLTFQAVDEKRFPALKLVYQALRAGPAHCIALNAANEMAVQAFLNQRLSFSNIVPAIEATLTHTHNESPDSIEGIMAIDTWARKTCTQWMENTAQHPVV